MDTPSGQRGTPLYDVAALRALEARMAGRTGDGFELMARAGQAAWRELLARWQGVQRIVVVCGPGNNGGDGYELCRHAHESGRDARVLRIDAHAPRSELARRAFEAYREAGGRVAGLAGGFGGAQVVVDALFGIGLSRAPDEASATVIEAINASGLPVFSLDVPSGLDADRGSAPGAVVRASHTLQLLGPHPGLHTGQALACTGTLALATLGADAALAQVPVAAWRLAAGDLRGWIPRRSRIAHKGDSGHVLCVGGDLGQGGAVLLAAEAALRCGAGLVSVATRSTHVPALLARRPEAMTRGVDGAAALAPLLARADVVAVGPGLGQGPWGRALYAQALASERPLVLDADALNLLAGDPRELPADAILTPHPGEAARLLAVDTAQVQGDRYAAAARLVERFGCVVVLKGAGTVVAAPGQAPRVVAAGNPGMAVGGMGDLLTGCIAALRARGMPAFESACLGALLHAVAGDHAARDGEAGLLPTDLLPWLRTLANDGPRA